MPKQTEERFWEKVDIPHGGFGCWEWNAARNARGYGVFSLPNKGGPWRNKLSHRFSFELCHGTIPEGLYICHHCDNPSCVNPSHLFAGTQKDNARDRDQKGRGVFVPPQKGEAHPNAKLTQEQVVAIRADTRTLTEIAKDYDVTNHAIHRIRTRKTWRHV